MRNIRNRRKHLNHINSFILKVPVLGSRVSYMLRILSSTLMVPDPGFHPWDGSRVSGPRSHLWDESRAPPLGSRVPPKWLVSGLGSYQKSRVSGPTFRICLRNVSGATNVIRWSMDFFNLHLRCLLLTRSSH